MKGYSNCWRKRSNLVYHVSDRAGEPWRGAEAKVLKALEGKPQVPESRCLREGRWRRWRGGSHEVKGSNHRAGT